MVGGTNPLGCLVDAGRCWTVEWKGLSLERPTRRMVLVMDRATQGVDIATIVYFQMLVS